MCRLAYTLHNSPRIQAVNAIHVLVCFVTIGEILLYLRTPSVQRVFAVVGKNLKARRQCFFAHAQYVVVSTAAFPAFHAALLLERGFTICFDLTKRGKKVVGAVVISSFLIIPYAYLLAVYLENFIWPDSPYCAGIFSNRLSSYETSFESGSLMLLVDSLVTLLDLVLLIYNRKQIARYYSTIATTYCLNRSFFLKEIQISIKLIFPFSLVHSIFFALQYGFYFLYLSIVSNLDVESDAFYKELTNVIRSSSTLFHFFVLCVFHRFHEIDQDAQWLKKKEETNETDLYFAQFKRMIA
ncbi:hypothetical protein M3Y99_00770000 [Aphelenchoides fujianensis]|nr:hypothetical protein M3Y99_00770000 [Aphelenchoides fujianensis]